MPGPTLTFPPNSPLPILDGSNWSIWLAQALALLRMNGFWDHIVGTLRKTFGTWSPMTPNLHPAKPNGMNLKKYMVELAPC